MKKQQHLSKEKRAKRWVPAALVATAVIASACDSGASAGGSASGTGGASCNVRAQGAVQKLLMARTSGPVSAIPKAVAKFKDQGALDESKQLPVTLSLTLNNESDLEQRLSEMYSPGNPNYGKFMSPEEFRTRYAPSADQVAKVQDYLKSNGIQNVEVNANGYLVTATADAKTLNTVFKANLHQYKDASGKAYFAPSTEPVLPEGLGIEAVHGLHNVSVRHAHSRPIIPSADSKAGHTGTGHSGGLSASDVRGAYNMNIPGLDGTGQTMALMELDAYNQSDVTAYEQYNNLPNATVTPIDAGRGSTTGPGGGQAEVTLDIELMIAVAPGAQILVYEGANSDTGILATYAAIANDNKAKTASTSWGSAEDGTSSSLMQSENTVFMQMAAQGQSIFSAAGDSGAKDDGSSLSIDDPSGQPYMTAVGGTSLNSNGPTYVSETTWTDGGGGISSTWPQPSWQQGLATSANKASSTMRNIPDVSVEGDMAVGYDIYQAGGWGTWGGTSCGAPIWAAFTALVNQQRGSAGPIGFINPALYNIGRGGNSSRDFHDVADGSTNGYYPATAGFDDATGWGSMDGANLLQDLAAGSGQGGGC